MSRKRSYWTQSAMDAALNAVKRGQSTYKAAEAYGIPRRTLRDYLKNGLKKRKLGRKPILSTEQEKDFVKRIIRYAEIGVPFTSKMIRRQVYAYCEKFAVPNNFNKKKKLAGRDWLKLFMKRNPNLAKRKAQFLNQARGQKLNKAIVSQHFREVEKIYDELGIHYNPERLYNMDEKGCRLTLHHQPTVIMEKGAKRAHIQASEHGENVTIVGCANAVGSAIPPMVIFKGKRHSKEYDKYLPFGSKVEMAPKGSMTTELFIKFLQHFAKFKVAGKCLLIFDGAKSHLDFKICNEAERLGIVLYCLPSNTTHELQPLDKACFKPFETYWDDEILEHFDKKRVTRKDFNKILTKIWPRALSEENVTSGFRATGLYPFNPNILPESAFAPSVLTERPAPPNIDSDSSTDSSLTIDSEELRRLTRSISPNLVTLSYTDFTPPSAISDNDPGQVNELPEQSQDSQGLCTKKLVCYSSTDISECEDTVLQPLPKVTSNQTAHLTPPHLDHTSIPSTSGIQPRVINNNMSSTDGSDAEDFWGTNIIKQIVKPRISQSIHIYSSDSNSDSESSEYNKPLSLLSKNTHFHQFLPTPNYAVTKKTPRRKAINYKGTRVTKDLFNNPEEILQRTKTIKKSTKKKDSKDQERQKSKTVEKNKSEMKSSKNKGKGKKTSIHKKKNQDKENESGNWYCPACKEDRVADMRPCWNCVTWYHEECIGWTENDEEAFTCPKCCPP